MLKFTLLPAVMCSVMACGQSPQKADAQTAVIPSNTVNTAAMVTATVAGGLDWPCYRGPQKNGISAETGINKNWSAKPPKKLWQVSLSDGGYSGPSVSNGMVFIIDHQGSQDIVRALSLATGQQVWQYAYEDTDSANYGFARSTPTVDGDKVYTMSRLGVLNCLDFKTGKPIWTRDVVKDFGGERPGWDLAGSPLIDGKAVVVAAGGQKASVVALDKTTGQTIWQGGGSSVPGYSSAVIATINGTRQYVITVAKGIIGVDTASGNLLWGAQWQNQCDVLASNVIVIGNSVFVACGYGKGCAMFEISGSNANMLWQSKDMQPHFSSPILSGGYIYGNSDPGNLVCIDPKSGQTMWKQPGFEKGGVVGVDGTIIAMNGSQGDVIMASLSPNGYKELGRMNSPLGGQSWTAPIVAQGKLIIRNTKTLACYDLK
jgi:outer membrane protein assembly factor BamB